MIPKECKRLAEVDFPIAVVSRHSAREKSIRHGHPSTLHLWWARRPLAACRSMLMALLLPDPEDQNCPAEFKTTARSLLGKMTGKIGAKDADLRAALLHFIGDFANWDNSSTALTWSSLVGWRRPPTLKRRRSLSIPSRVAGRSRWKHCGSDVMRSRVI